MAMLRSKPDGATAPPTSGRQPHPDAADLHDDVRTGGTGASGTSSAPSGSGTRSASGADGGGGFSLRAPARRSRGESSSANAPIVPASSVTGSSLTMSIAIMCFLACLTAGGVYIVNQSAAAWMRNIAGEVTIQILPKNGVDIEQQVTSVAFHLAKQGGIVGVRPYTIEESSALLEPWLGKSEVLNSLPVPRLIALELNRSQPPDLDALAQDLETRFEGVRLDDHRHWQVQIRTVTRSIALGGLAVLVLVGIATTLIIVSATRSAMLSNREIVEVLHFVGATDRFIAREFEKHFLTVGIRAGFVGAVSALGVFLAMPSITRLLGGGHVTAAELRRLIGSGTLDIPGYLLLGIVVIVIAALCMLTSRYGVFRILHARD